MFRFLTTADAAMCAALHQSGFHPQQQWDSAFFATLFAAPLTRGLALPKQAGFVLWQHGPDVAEIYTLVVAPTKRGQGLGSQLLQQMHSTLQADNIECVMLDVAVDNQAALRLYQRTGYTETARRHNYYRREEGAVDALVLQKIL